ncbi:MAG: hypothetical protein WBA23_03055 [Tunicatimonas sp.]|uniref:hypothetical protein n=1 Tax=Tunicatimonas sp. TaxID=1940096 RepID=UPI003C74C3C4
MALTNDIKTDVRYQEGKEEMIVAMLKSGLLSDKQIAQIADTSLKQIQKIRKSIEK